MKLILTAIVLFFPLWGTFAQHPSGTRPVAFTNVTLIDMIRPIPRKGMTVVISGGKIAAVGKTGSVTLPHEATVIDSSGLYMIPGLWDMHIHLQETERTFPLLLANGVVGVRNMGGDLQKLFRWREEVASGRVIGPTIVACGPVIDGPNPWNPDHALSVRDPNEAVQAVDFLKSAGADFIKIYDGVSRETYFAIVREGKKQHLPVGGHIPPQGVTMAEASDAGQKSVEHLGTFLQGSSAVEKELWTWPETPAENGDFSVIPTRIAARGTRMLDTFDEARSARLLAKLAKNQTWQVPTLRTKQVNTFVDEISKNDRPEFQYIPKNEREDWKPDQNFFYKFRTAAFIDYQRRLFRKEMDVVRSMNRAGVPILAGTDVGPYMVPGFALHEELELLVEAGLSPYQALGSATIGPARFLNQTDRRGTIAVGKIADLVLLEADPLTDISNTRKINAVVRGGMYFPKSALKMMLANAEKSARATEP